MAVRVNVNLADAEFNLLRQLMADAWHKSRTQNRKTKIANLANRICRDSYGDIGVVNGTANN